MKMGLKQVLFNDELKVYQGDKLVATGHYNLKYQLIEMNDTINSSVNAITPKISLETWHKRMNHANLQIVRKISDYIISTLKMINSSVKRA